uniref:Variant surface glycoprotein 1125.347 n=1 Tax=Trypanosoma brucei TaxID=5691 RepID=A0A1J0R5Q4_9TRYP|nr:variant surface glycoprotein 1125.347 [Trypanosoma brucei]
MMIYLFLAGMMVSCAMHTQAAEDPAAAAINTPCEADIYLAALQATLKQRLAANANAAKELTDQARTLKVAAVATADATKSCLLAAAAVVAAEKAKATQQQADQRSTAFKTALDQITKLRTELAAVATISQLRLAVKADGHRQKESTQATHSIIQADAQTPLGCTTTNKQAEGKINSLEPNPTKLLSLRIADSTKAAHGTADNVLELAMSGSCNHGGVAYTTWTAAAANCQQATITSLAPKIVQTGHTKTTRHEPIKTLQIYATPGSVGDCNPNHDKATEDEKPAEYAAKAICNALRTQPAAGKQITLSGEALTADMLVVQAAGSCLPAYRGKAKLSEEEQTTLTKFLKDAYGKDSDAFNAKFTTLKPGHKVIIHKGGEVQAVDIGDIRTDGETLNAISIILAKRAAQIAATKQQTKAVDSKTEEKYKEDAEESKCTADKDCEHKGGKCKLKEGVKTENDAKTTRTTGSNSFTIKKAPLLLAVFILE